MKTLRTKPIYKLYFRYKNINLWKNKTITHFTKKKWILLKVSKTSPIQYNRGIYLYHYKKLNLTRLYYYKFINKQLLKKYLVNYTESSFKSILFNNIQIFEKRLDFNLYQTHFVPSLYAARFFITKGYILVNKHIVKNTNFTLKAHDLVEINPKYWNKCFSFINQNQIYTNKITFAYLRNIEIDYTILSFIFLDNKQFYILQFENFIKKIYFNLNQKKVLSTNNKNNSFNNYFKFFETTFNYYLFLDDTDRTFKYKIKINNFRILNLLKYLRLYYNDYFFRNILLKRIFLYKYNYLNFIINSSNLNTNNLVFLKNINTNFTLEYHSNQLQNEFYKYIFNCIFKFYLYLLKNYYINNYLVITSNFKSINNYNYILLTTKILIYIFHIKTILINYFSNTAINNNYIDIYKNNKYKLINNNCRVITLSSKRTTYLTWYKFQLLLYYISSNRFKYKIYRKCTSFRQNIIKRYKLILQIRKTLNYRYYNQFCIGTPNYLYTSHFIRNCLNNCSLKDTKLLNSNNNNNSQIKKGLVIYYPKTSNLYQTLYTTLSNQINITKNDIQKELHLIKELLKNKNINSTTSITILNNFISKLNNKLTFFTTERSFINFNYNKVYKNIFLLSNLINIVTLTTKNINYNLTNLTYTFLYKINVRNNYLYNKYNELYTTSIKRYHRYTNYFNQRLKVNYYYINSCKIRHVTGTNLKKYFTPLKLKINSNYFIYLYNRTRKQRSKYFYKRITNINSLNSNSIKLFNLDNYNFNMHIITNNLKFNDNLFYIDLLLNLSIRKLNKLYNYTNNLKYFNLTNSIKINLPVIKINKKISKRNITKNYKFLFYSPLYTYYKIKTFNTNLIKFSNLLINTTNKNSNLIIYYSNQNMHNTIFLNKYFTLMKKHLSFNIYLYSKSILLNKKNIISKYNFNLIFNYYNSNIRKYKLIKYLYKFYIFKEYDNLLNQIITFKNIKTTDMVYIKQIYYNLLFTKLFNFNKYNSILQNNYYFSRNLRIMINYFIIIKRLYK